MECHNPNPRTLSYTECSRCHSHIGRQTGNAQIPHQIGNLFPYGPSQQIWKNFRRFWPAVLLPQKARKNGSKINSSESCYLVRYSKIKRASKQSNNNAVAAATSLSPAQCKSQSFLRALFAARVCAVLTLLPISVNWAIGCLKWIAAAAFLLLLLLLLIAPESSFRHVALDSQYHVQQCGSSGVANDNIPRVASGPNNYRSPIPSDL